MGGLGQACSARRVAALTTLLLLLAFLFLIFLSASTLPLELQSSPVPHYQASPQAAPSAQSRDLLILSWTHKFSQKRLWWPEGGGAFRRCGGLPAGASCRYTADRALYNRSEAVLINPHRREALPAARLPHHKWVFWALEPPANIESRFDLRAHSAAFNLTSTYASSSDVQIPYVKTCSRSPEVTVPPASHYASLVAGKDKLVAWFVSRCVSRSRREDYVRELQKHIPVDVYGRCGPLTCDRDSPQLCYDQLLQRRYKFYLSFENSLCLDYVSEKLWNIYPGVDVVPVVLGGANYSKLLAPHTYIDVRDFKSPAHLAQYLKYLDADNDAYVEYLRNKAAVRCAYVTGEESYACALCRTLYERRGRTDILPDLRQFWQEEHTCVSPNVFFKHTHNDTWSPLIMDDS